jgi:hypothetical protein
MTRKLLVLLVLAFGVVAGATFYEDILPIARAQGVAIGLMEIKEADESPIVNDVKRIVVSNGTLTDNGVIEGKQQVTLSTGGGGGGGGAPVGAEYFTKSADATLTNEILLNTEGQLETHVLGGANAILSTEIDSAAEINAIIADGAIDDDDLTDDTIATLSNVNADADAADDEVLIGDSSEYHGALLPNCSATQLITYDTVLNAWGCRTDLTDPGSFEIGAGRQPNRVRFRDTTGSQGRVLVIATSEAVKIGTTVTKDGDTEGYWSHEAADTPAAQTGMEFIYDHPSDQDLWFNCRYQYEMTFNGATDQCGNILFLNFTPDNSAVRWVSPFLYTSTGNKLDASAANVDHGQLPAGMQFMLSRMNVETASGTVSGTLDFDWFEDNGTTNLNFGCQISGGGSTCTEVADEGFTTAIDTGLLLRVTPATTPTVSETAVSVCLGTPFDADTVNNTGPLRYWHTFQKHAEDTHSVHTPAEDGQWAPLDVTTQGNFVIQGEHTILMEDGLALQAIGYAQDFLGHGNDASYSVGYWEVSCNELPLTGTTTPYVEQRNTTDDNFTGEPRRFNGGLVHNTGASADIRYKVVDGTEIQKGQSVTLYIGAADGNDIEFCYGSLNRLMGPEGAGSDDQAISTSGGFRGDSITLLAEADGDLRVISQRGTWTEGTCSI